MDMEGELRCTRPDYVVYVPGSLDGSTCDTGNEHFLVFDAPDGNLAAVWTQSTREGCPDQRIVFARSEDEGTTWTGPRVVAGPDVPAGALMASWGFPMVSASGRIYVLYSRHIGRDDQFKHTTGLMAGVHSDDNGATWSEEQVVEMPRTKWDNPDPEMPANWIVWQKPLRFSEGKYFTGFTRWVSPTVRPPAPMQVWWAAASVVSFMRFENLDDDPEVRDIEVYYFHAEDDALRVGLVGHPDVPVAQEPSIVKLPDGRLFCTMRATTGHPYWTQSADAGRSWTQPEPLRFHEGSAPMRHPCSPCPIYQTDEGEYVFLFHNHDGHFGQYTPEQTMYHRRPVCLCRGRYRPEADQPVWFSDPAVLMDHEGLFLGAHGGRGDLAMYASFTVRDERRVLWYPERKFFLLGKTIDMEWLRKMDVREL
jgi:hypothetical protein